MFITAITAAVLASTNPVATAATPTPQPAVKADAAANPRVCIDDIITGSRIPQRTCKRLNEWRAAGIDPLAKP